MPKCCLKTFQNIFSEIFSRHRERVFGFWKPKNITKQHKIEMQMHAKFDGKCVKFS